MTPPRLTRSIPRLALKADEAAHALGMSRAHFDRYVKDALPVVYSGQLLLYPIEGLQAWLDGQAVRPRRRAA